MLKNQSGQGLTEYIVLLMLVAVVSIAAVGSLGKTVRAKITEAESKINSVSSEGLRGGANSAAGSTGIGGLLGGGGN